MYQVPSAANGFVPPYSQTVASGRSSWLERSNSGDWTVHGSGGDDRVRVTETCQSGNKFLSVLVNEDSYLIPIEGPSAAQSVGIYAGAGNDSVFVDPAVTTPLFINGGTGNDYLKGGSGPNALLGGGGNDILVGGRSDDILLGGTGYDTVQGNGGRDLYSIADLYARLREGRCDPVSQPQPQPQQQPLPQALPPAPASQPPQPPVVVCPPPHATPQQPVVQNPIPYKPKGPARPPLSSLLANVDTHDEKGFKSGREMTKRLLTALYTSPSAFSSALASLSRAGERDDAAASFVRALLEAGPGGAKLLKDLSASQKKTLADYIGAGNSWSANKKGIMILMSRQTGAWDRGFGQDKSALDYARRYQGVFA